jgi:hypothetical protein
VRVPWIAALVIALAAPPHAEARVTAKAIAGAASRGASAKATAWVLPGLSLAISTKHAWSTFHDPRAKPLSKTIAAAKVGADAIRIAFPAAGALCNAALAGVSLGGGLVDLHRAHRPAVQRWR